MYRSLGVSRDHEDLVSSSSHTRKRVLNETEDTRNSPRHSNLQTTQHPYGRTKHTHPCVARPITASETPQNVINSETPPPFKIWTVLSDRSPVRPLEPSASTHSPGMPRPPAKPCFEPGPHHYHNTHASPTTRTHRHPALTSHGLHHTECSASAPHPRSSAPLDSYSFLPGSSLQNVVAPIA